MYRILLASCLSLAACRTIRPAVGDDVGIPSDTASTCALHCEQLNLQFGGVVLAHDSAGCICLPKNSPPSAGAAIQSGAAAALVESGPTHPPKRGPLDKPLDTAATP